MDDKFPKSVAELRAELDKLRSELRKRDSNGDRRESLKILAQMIAAQKEFMNRWPWRPEGSSASRTPGQPSGRAVDRHKK